MEDQQDASGLLYRRNRYYDPATGRFTQEDPIGLGGGVNLYGFANGDPVSYSDPYGLAACNWLTQGRQCVAERLRVEMARHGHYITQLEAEYYVDDTGTALIAAVVVRRASGFANQMASKYPSRAGVANAARHQFGQCLMTKLAGEEIAATAADLHEAGATDPEDSRRDQANDRIGRAIGRGGPTVNCAAAVDANIQSGNYDWESVSTRQSLNPSQ